MKKNKTITIEVLLSKLKDKFKDLELTRRHLADIIKDNNVSLKLTHIRHEPNKRFGKDININEKLKEFYKEIKKHNIKDIICIDETSINALQKRHHCYNDVGKLNIYIICNANYINIAFAFLILIIVIFAKQI